MIGKDAAAFRGRQRQEMLVSHKFKWLINLLNAKFVMLFFRERLWVLIEHNVARNGDGCLWFGHDGPFLV